MYLLISLCLFLLTKESSSALLTVPANVAVVAGDTVTLQASSDRAMKPAAFIQWFITTCILPPGSASHCPAAQTIYDGFYASSLPPRYTINATNDGTVYWNAITINPVLTADANLYACQDPTYATYLAQVIVLATNPTCFADKSEVTETQDLTFICTVDYSGGFAPVMQFNSSTIDGSGAVNLTTSATSSYSLTVTADRSMAGDTIDCFTYFDQPHDLPSSIYASNIPTYGYTASCTIPPITYCPDNCTLTVSQCTPGTDITCSAAGNPVPTYLWVNIDNMEIISEGPLLNGSSIVTGLTYTCLASNDVGAGCSCSASCKVSSKTTPPTAGNTTPAPISSTVAIKGSLLSALAALIGIISYYCLTSSSSSL